MSRRRGNTDNIFAQAHHFASGGAHFVPLPEKRCWLAPLRVRLKGSFRDVHLRVLAHANVRIFLLSKVRDLRSSTQLAVYGELKNIALSFQSEGSQPRLREPTQFAVYGELKNIALFGVRE